MTILQTPYETSVEKRRQMSGVREAVMKALASRNLDVTNPKIRIMFVNRRNAILNDIPFFAHPIQPDPQDADLLAVDMRPYVKESGAFSSNIQITRPAAYQLQMARALFNYRWLKESKVSLLAVSSVPMGAYADWVASPFANKISGEELIQVKILAAFFYYCQFFDNTEFYQADVLKIVQLIARSTGTAMSRVGEVLARLDNGSDAVRAIKDIHDFCQTVAETGNSPRLRTVTPETLVPTLSMTWDGRDSMAIVATALEFPPTWIAFVLLACISRGHQRSRLAESVIRVGDKKNLAFIAKALMASVDFEVAQELGRQ